MVFLTYSLLDVKTGIYSQPFFSVHDASAFRLIVELASDRKTTVATYPSDYVLYRIGTFDDNSGAVLSFPPVSLGAVAAIVAAVAPTNVLDMVSN